MKNILSKVKSGGKFSIALFGVYVAVQLSSGEGCSDIKDRIGVHFGLESKSDNDADAGQK